MSDHFDSDEFTCHPADERLMQRRTASSALDAEAIMTLPEFSTRLKMCIDRDYLIDPEFLRSEIRWYAMDYARAAVERVIAERDGARTGVLQAAMVNKLLKERAERAEAALEDAIACAQEAEARCINEMRERDALKAMLLDLREVDALGPTLLARIDAACENEKA